MSVREILESRNLIIRGRRRRKEKRNIYYPVRNSDFREWQKKHKRGGDFIIFSDKKFVRLDKPIRVFL
ncbi:DUF6402 family protein [Burkholderia sp. Bp8998]|uniref:DUF6402 family protein n=1 Tax=Burkholderia sp. Bp8998 TaxID=2184557 RepID=UPI001C8A6417